MEAEEKRLVTTRAVLLENDPGVQIVPITKQLYKTAFGLYRGRPDKEWGITDCLSFVVMEDRGLPKTRMYPPPSGPGVTPDS